MGLYRNHPRKCKTCVFCNYWISDIKLRFVSPSVGYEYESYTNGKCAKSGSTTRAYSSCAYYQPSTDARKLL